MKKVHVPVIDLNNIDAGNFSSAALQIFQYQAASLPVYRNFLQLLDIRPDDITDLHQIPFLPVSLYKNNMVIAEGYTPQLIFESSGTTGSNTSRHPVADIEIYKQSIRRGFELMYGNPQEYCILGLLPSYLERKNASLIFMVNYLMQLSGNPRNGFYLDNQLQLHETLRYNEANSIKTILLGVSFALIDFAENFSMPLQHTLVMETGGMKGRRKEMTRQELHEILKQSFHVRAIHSEYGMTELLSQAYSQGNGKFSTPPWMQILIRDADDPFYLLPENKNGLINIIDLANIYSCSFIETQDTGILYDAHTFSVTGRFDTADIRGCNLLVV